MRILLAFAPFIAFALVAHFVGDTEGLVTGALVAAALLLRDFLSAGRSPKILEIGTVILFSGLAIYTVLAGPDWSVASVRLRVDAGLLLIVLVSLAARKPFTLQYAREQVAKELWDRPEFIRINYVITAVWAGAFAVMVLADLLLLYVPEVPAGVGLFLTVAAIVAAVKFTSWYPKRKAGPPQTR